MSDRSLSVAGEKIASGHKRPHNLLLRDRVRYQLLYGCLSNPLDIQKLQKSMWGVLVQAIYTLSTPATQFSVELIGWGLGFYRLYIYNI